MKKTIIIMCLILASLLKAQVTVGIINLKVNNVAQSVNNPINLGMNNTVNVIFLVTLNKDQTYLVGNARLYIRAYNSENNTFSDLLSAPIDVSPNDFKTSAASAINVNISTNHVGYNPGSYLVAILHANDSGAGWSSPQVPIIRGPSFTLTPSKVAIPCNSKTPVVFTVNSTSSVGSFSYNWYVGNGWSHLGSPATGMITTSVNSITLTPTNSNVLPSSISVVPVWNNKLQASLNSTVSREGFNENITISGNASVCNYPSIVTYDISNLPGGSAVWSSSDETVGKVISTNGTQVSLNILKEGPFTLSAVITNACGQKKTIIKKIRVGAPNITNMAERQSHCSFAFRAKDYYPSENSDTKFTWSYVSGTGNASPSNFSTIGDFASIYACPPFEVRLKITASNSCGTTESFADLWLKNDEEEISRIGNNSQYFTVSPNPADDYINISLVDNNKISPKLVKVQGELYNNLGQKVNHIILNNNKGTLSVKDLLRGTYTLKITYDNKVENHRIIKK